MKISGIETKWILFSFFLIVWSCSDGQQNDYYPISEGRTWEYSDSKKRKGKWVTTTTRIVVLPDRQLKDKRAYPLKTKIDGQYVFQFVEQDSSGVYLFAIQLPTQSEPTSMDPVYIIKAPYKVGSEWEQVSTFGTITSKTVFKIMADNDTVTVAAGSFSRVLRIVATSFIGLSGKKAGIGGTTTSWYAPSVGFIQSNTEMGGEVVQTSQLVSYTQ